jgi:hypothetical protein
LSAEGTDIAHAVHHPLPGEDVPVAAVVLQLGFMLIRTILANPEHLSFFVEDSAPLGLSVAEVVLSSESNGIAEAFVETLKSDCARVHPLPCAATVLRQIRQSVPGR